MALNSGTRLGPYEIQSPIGAGGMGEVYSARDTRLDRTVAIKILPEHLANDSDACERFEREAKTISSMSHTNICQLYDIGQENNIRFLVMEYLQGETLADRLRKGPLPIEQLLRVGAEIGDGLDRAHRSGIVHRDLKPGNIMLTKSGAKILDFGLAKTKTGLATPASDLTATFSSPTATHPLTAKGTLLGTFQYMSPEQVEGNEATSCSDIFSYGAVLYEMATGKRAFDGKSQISVASAILEKEPEPLTIVLPTAPAALDHVIRGCLPKDPESRWQSAGDVARQLRWIATSSSSSLAGVVVPSRSRRRVRERLLWGALVVALLGALLFMWMASRARGPLPVFRASLIPPPGAVFDFDGDFSGPPVLSPDGTLVAFCARMQKERNSIWVQSLDTAASRKLGGTEGAAFPFWSRDGKFIAFFVDGTMKKIPVAGGPIVTITEAPNARGGAWGSDNTIVFAPDYRGYLWKVSANGGTAVRAVKLDESLHDTQRWPTFLPDGRHFLFLATNHGVGVREKYGIYMGSLDNDESKQVLASDSGGQFAAGYLLFHRESQLVAQKFDWKNGTLSGEPFTLADNLDFDSGTWHSTFTATESGVLLYQGTVAKSGYDLTWVDRRGATLGKAAEAGAYNGARLSPDGKRVAIALGDPKPDIWVFDLARGTRVRLTFDSALHQMPSWSADGQKIAFTTQTGMTLAFGATLHAKQANGMGQDDLLLAEGKPGESPITLFWPQWSADGKYLTYQRLIGPTGASLWAVPTSGEKKPFPVVQPQSPAARIVQTRLSPDGKWLAYSSTDSGREEVYVTPFPSGSSRWQISQSGGGYPVWRGDSKEIYYAGLSDAALHAVEVKVNGNEFEAGIPQTLFVIRATSAVGYPYDAAPDGQRFLIPMPQQDMTAAPMSLVVNWPGALNK